MYNVLRADECNAECLLKSRVVLYGHKANTIKKQNKERNGVSASLR